MDYAVGENNVFQASVNNVPQMKFTAVNIVGLLTTIHRNATTKSDSESTNKPIAFVEEIDS